MTDSGDSPTLSRMMDGSPVQGPALSAVGERAGDSIGPYRLLEVIGEGGFGTVFLAEQERPVSRRVALKVIKLGMDTRQVVARFEQERQALAVMDHPCIAKVFDAGATGSGRPFFVMELVRGEPIVEYCDKHSLSVRDRLEVFLQVCAAVQHAHSKGIIHRDLKPSNVLVSEQDGRPRPKVIDFGIAKATASKLTDKTLYTEQRSLIGTPEYMSPEQAEGSFDIDTRTDVYSLGVMLYELLTGTTPFSSKELRSAAYGDIQRIIREVDPPRPSTRLHQNSQSLAQAAARRRTEPRRLVIVVRGELDWVVMKAMEKDRARRYDTPSALAADVGRYLTGEPVAAAPPSTAYRVRTFVRRHKGAVAASGLVAGALVLGIVGTTAGLVRSERLRGLAVEAQKAEAHQKALAEDRLQEAEATVRFLDEMLAAADPSALGREVTVRSVVDRASAALASRPVDRPLVAARLNSTLARTYLALGEYAPARDRAQDSVSIYTSAHGPDHADTCRAANVLYAVMVKLAEFEEAEPVVRDALTRHERLFGRTDPITVDTIDTLAQLYAAMLRIDEATALARELVDRRRAAVGSSAPETLSAMNTLAMLYADAEADQQAVELYEEAMSSAGSTLGPEHPLTLHIGGNLALCLYHGSMRLKTSDPKAHEEWLARSRELGERTLEARRRVLGPEHPETSTASNNLTLAYRQLGMWEQADALAIEDIELSVRTLGELHPDTVVSLANMGRSLSMRKRYAEGDAYFERALRGARASHPPDFPGTAFILGWYGSSLRDQGRFAQAEPMLLEARGIIGRALGEDHPIALEMNRGLVMLYAAWHDAEPGQGHDAQAAEWSAKIPGGGG